MSESFASSVGSGASTSDPDRNDNDVDIDVPLSQEQVTRQQEIYESMMEHGSSTLTKIENIQSCLDTIQEDLKFFQDVRLRTPAFVKLQISVLYTWRQMIHELYEQLDVVRMEIANFMYDNEASDRCDEGEVHKGNDGGEQRQLVKGRSGERCGRVGGDKKRVRVG